MRGREVVCERGRGGRGHNRGSGKQCGDEGDGGRRRVDTQDVRYQKNGRNGSRERAGTIPRTAGHCPRAAGTIPRRAGHCPGAAGTIPRTAGHCPRGLFLDNFVFFHIGGFHTLNGQCSNHALPDSRWRSCTVVPPIRGGGVAH
jgi:hypothetical protein